MIGNTDFGLCWSKSARILSFYTYTRRIYPALFLLRMVKNTSKMTTMVYWIIFYAKSVTYRKNARKISI
jgi:hypothetical protein